MKTPANANYADWARHFGQSTLNPELIAEYQAAGIAKVPIIGRDDVEESEDVGALTVTVTDPSLFGNTEKLGQGVGIFSGIAIHLKDFGDEGYAGAMPFSIDRGDSRKTLRKKLGKPNISDEDEFWDEWIIDGLEVTAMYSEDFNDLMTLTVYLPEEED